MITDTKAVGTATLRLTHRPPRSEAVFQAVENHLVVKPVKVAVCLPSSPWLKANTTTVTIGASRNTIINPAQM
jgi:hypothetical protein